MLKSVKSNWVKMTTINQRKALYLWLLLWLAVTQSAFTALRRNQTLKPDPHKFGRKLTSTPTASTAPVEVFKPLKTVETVAAKNDTAERKNGTKESLKADDGLLWRSMTDGKSWSGYHVPETNINISYGATKAPLTYQPTTGSLSGYDMNTHMYIYASSPSPLANEVHHPGGSNYLEGKYSYGGNHDVQTRSPRYGGHTPSMTNRYQYPQQSQGGYGGGGGGGGGGQMGGGHDYKTPPAYSYSPPTSPAQPPHPPPYPVPSYASGYGQAPVMMMAPKDDGIKGMLNKLLSLLPIGLLLAVALPSLIVIPTRRSLDAAERHDVAHSYPILDMIGYYGKQSFENETCFRYIVCQTVKIGQADGANIIQKQLWSVAKNMDEKFAGMMGLRDLWEGITKNDCQKFRCKWKEQATTEKPKIT